MNLSNDNLQNSNYIVLARKYRPKKFSDILGQDNIIDIITNQIKNNKLSHALLFHGIRGIGKTTIARIISKSLNCLDRIGNIEPCLKCKNCLDIASGQSLDIIEFDGASKTSIEDIKEIINSCHYPPIASKYKIYIIDEVHMLSKSAFNALLKILEEPQQYVKFIFATTEINKIPNTILSRCQNFNLNRLDDMSIANHLKNILAKEDFTVKLSNISLIAHMAEGSVRDALTICDMLLSYNKYDKNINSEIIHKFLSFHKKDYIFDIFSNIINKNIREAINIFHQYIKDSNDIFLLIEHFLELINEIILYKLTSNINNKKFDNNKSMIEDFAKNTDNHFLLNIWQILLSTIKEMNIIKNHKILFEITLIKIGHILDLPNITNVIKNISENKYSYRKNINQNITEKIDQKPTNEQIATNNIESNIGDNIKKFFPNSKITKLNNE